MRKKQIIYLFISASLLLSLGSAQITGSLELMKDKVCQGEKTELIITLFNMGVDEIRNINVFINNTELELKHNITIPGLSPNARYSKSIEIQTFSSTEIKMYPITTYIIYEGKTLLLTSDFEVVPFPLQVEFDLEKSQMSVGEENKLTVDVSNVGDRDIKDLKVIITIPNKFNMNGSNNMTLETLTTHQTVSKDFFFSAQSGADGEYHIIIFTEFLDMDEETHQDSKFIKVTVGSGLGSFEIILLIIILVLLVSLFIRKLA